MKRVVSVSLGSSTRDKSVEMEILGEEFKIERIGTDGDKKKARQLLEELDGKVDAIGLGGTNLYFIIGSRKYEFRDTRRLISMLKRTPAVDGTGLRNAMEERLILSLPDRGIPIKGKKALVILAVDRFGTARGCLKAGCETTFGDLMFALGIPIPLKKIESVILLAKILMPILTLLPIEVFYPTGSKQEAEPKESSRMKFIREAEIIAGDLNYIKHDMPPDMTGKIVITNTTTPSDVEALRERGVSVLVTTTPRMQERTFGTNVIEAILVALSGKSPDELTPEEYLSWLDKAGFEPVIEKF